MKVKNIEVIICDRCGARTESTEKYKFEWIYDKHKIKHIKIKGMFDSFLYGWNKEYDLCPRCEMNFRQFMKDEVALNNE